MSQQRVFAGPLATELQQVYRILLWISSAGALEGCNRFIEFCFGFRLLELSRLADSRGATTPLSLRMTLPRFEWHGSSKLYACWIDESHNSMLRDVCRFSHRVTFERRIFSLFNLQRLVQSSGWLVLNSRSRRPARRR